MGSTDRTRRAQKLGAMAAAERRKRQSRWAVGAVVLVVLVLFALVAVKLTSGPRAASKHTTSASSEVLSAATSVPRSVFAAVGTGGVAPTSLRPLTKAPALTENGKPRVLYVGAEYCPYCAAERWAVVAALSRFGTFTGLGETTSSSTDVFPSTATLSFHGSSYSSRYLAFDGHEIESNQPQGNGYAPLDTLSASDQHLVNTYDAPPYVPAQSAGAIPFIDLGGRYLISGATYDPGVLQGRTHAQIARALSDPSSKIAQDVDGSANLITAALCRQTGDHPAAVCTAAGVRAADRALGQATTP
jgi:hypothetical protein